MVTRSGSTRYQSLIKGRCIGSKIAYRVGALSAFFSIIPIVNFMMNTKGRLRAAINIDRVTQ